MREVDAFELEGPGTRVAQKVFPDLQRQLQRQDQQKERVTEKGTLRTPQEYTARRCARRKVKKLLAFLRGRLSNAGLRIDGAESGDVGQCWSTERHLVRKLACAVEVMDWKTFRLALKKMKSVTLAYVLRQQTAGA